MNLHDCLSDDGQVVLLLTSWLALPKDPAAAGPVPFTPGEWNELADRIRDSALRTPAALHGRSGAQLRRELALAPAQAERIAHLLERAGRLALELESLFACGLWVVTQVDPLYPPRLRAALQQQAPPVLFGAGDLRLLQRAGLAVIGSRNLDEAGAAFAREVGRKAAASLPVVSGGARGTDRLGMQAALEAGGTAFGVLADSLERTVRQPDVLEFLTEGRLVLLTPYLPSAGFSVGAAMGRNKLIYGLAEFAIVVRSDFETGGTWAGAIEALKAGWCPVFVRQSAEGPRGHAELLKRGAAPLPEAELAAITDLPDWLRDHAPARPAEQGLFNFTGRGGPAG